LRNQFVITQDDVGPVAAVEQREAAFGGVAVVKSDSAVYQGYIAHWVYDGYAAERSLALLDSCYGTWEWRQES
jgi:hypothetical protein